MTSAEPAVTDSTPSPRVRVYYFDYLRVWATVGVVVLHSAALIVTVNRQHDVDLFSKFTVGDIYDSLGRFGVSCFFMISGALLLAPNHRFRLGRQTLRILVPLIVWSAVYALGNVYFAKQRLVTVNGSNPRDDSLPEALKAYFTGPLAYHLWFVYILVGIYLTVPLLRPITALAPEIRERLLRYALALWLVFTVAIPTIRHIWPSLIAPYAPAFPDFPTGYLGIVLLGFYLHHHAPTIPRWLLVIGAAAGAGSTALLVYLEQTRRDGSLWPYDNLTPQVAVFAACVFLLAKSTLDRPGRMFPFISVFSRLSFRIYLAHALILHYLRSISPFKDWYAANPLISIPVLAAMTLAATFALAWSLDRIKPLRPYI